MTDTTVTTDPPTGNQPAAREADGTLKDQTPPPEITTPTPEKKPEGQSFLTQTPPKEEPKPEPKEGDSKPEDKPKDAAGAPEKYADFKVPDGFKFDEKALTEATAAFKELGLSQEKAQKLVDTYAKNTQQAIEAPYKQWADLQKEWLGDIHDRFGSKAETVRTDISKAIDSAPPPSLTPSLPSAPHLPTPAPTPH